MIERLLIVILLMVLIMLPKSIYAAQLINSSVQHQINTKNPLTAELNKDNFTVIGKAKFSVLFWDIYQSTLLTTSGNYPIKNKQHQLLFEINYLKDISRDELIERTVQQWQHIGIKTANYQDYIPALKRIWPNIKKGDTLSLVITNQNSAFYFNQQYIGSINDAAFGQRFIDIWLARNTSQPKLRKQLLGNTRHE
jgi:hypothetical protein